jgi:enoyl-CoA hydratase/carnithine racemase
MTPPQFEDLLYEDRGGVAKIIINRPRSLNSLTGITMRELTQAIEHAGLDRSIGVIVITGAGDRAFSSGGDVKWEKGRPGTAPSGFNPRAVHEAIRHCGKPVIAAVKGYALAWATTWLTSAT